MFKFLTDDDIKKDYEIYLKYNKNHISFEEFEKKLQNTFSYRFYELSKAFGELKKELCKNFNHGETK